MPERPPIRKVPPYRPPTSGTGAGPVHREQESRPDPVPAVAGPSFALPDAAFHAALGARFSAALLHAAVNRNRAAVALGVTRGAVTLWCQGKCPLSLVRVCQAIDVLKLDPAILFPEWFQGGHANG